ncbi:hypothetical protein ACJX0J_026288 [Zea mays]
MVYIVLTFVGVKYTVGLFIPSIVDLIDLHTTFGENMFSVRNQLAFATWVLLMFTNGLDKKHLCFAGLRTHLRIKILIRARFTQGLGTDQHMLNYVKINLRRLKTRVQYLGGNCNLRLH